MSQLPDADLLTAFDAAVEAFARLPRDRGDAQVPACPGWDVHQLQEHMGQIHGWVATILTTRPEDRPERERGRLPDGTDRHAFVADRAAAARAALVAADPDDTVWTFSGPKPARWWLRRQAHETTLHALDAIEAVGTGSLDVPPALAADGVDEVLDVFLRRSPGLQQLSETGETVHLHATDTAGEWLLRFAPGQLVVTTEHAKGDVAARGPALDLLRLLWGRATGPELAVFGDAGLLDRMRAASRL